MDALGTARVVIVARMTTSALPRARRVWDQARYAWYRSVLAFCRTAELCTQRHRNNLVIAEDKGCEEKGIEQAAMSAGGVRRAREK